MNSIINKIDSLTFITIKSRRACRNLDQGLICTCQSRFFVLPCLHDSSLYIFASTIFVGISPHHCCNNPSLMVFKFFNPTLLPGKSVVLFCIFYLFFFGGVSTAFQFL